MIGTERIAALAACALVAVAVIAGCSLIGSPEHARAQALDRRRGDDLAIVAERLRSRYTSAGPRQSEKLPAVLPRDLRAVRSDGSDATRDPTTGVAYRYVRDGGHRFRLCATFALAGDGTIDTVAGFERHPAGSSCFALDAAGTGPPEDAVPGR